MSGAADSSSLPPIAPPPPRHSSARANRPSSKQFQRNIPGSPQASIASSDDDVSPESDAMQSDAVASSADTLSASQQEKMQLFTTSPDLELLCRENGLSASQFARNCELVTSLDMFLGFWASMKSAMHFPALKELSIINQPTIYAVELSARNKQIAEATMIKKKMYYNMRIKTIKRDVHSRIRHAEAIRNQAEHHMETSVAALVRQKKEIERFLVEKTEKITEDMLEKLEKKLE
ncbi:hypothetical protein JG688_00002716, partial [Phytophthora aleatoria]